MKKSSHINASAGSKAFDIINYAFILIFCVLIILPIWNLIVTAFSRPEDASVLRMELWPKRWSATSIEYALSDQLVLTAFVNSILRTVVGTVYDLVLCCAAAFAMTRTDIPFRRTLTLFFLLTMFFSGGMIPTYLNIRNLGLIDSFWVYILPNGFEMYNAVIIRNYFYSIDKSMEEAATIDGASVTVLLSRILLPLSAPVLATVGMWRMVAHWNTWFDNLAYIRNDSLITLQYMLHQIQSNVAAQTDKASQSVMALEQSMRVTPQSILAATTLIVIIPITCVYPFLQRFFIKGIMLGASKG